LYQNKYINALLIAFISDKFLNLKKQVIRLDNLIEVTISQKIYITDKKKSIAL